jgi:hypothetical protein
VPEITPRENREPEFHLVEPGGMGGATPFMRGDRGDGWIIAMKLVTTDKVAEIIQIPKGRV